jgi:DNA polymerase I
MTNW